MSKRLLRLAFEEELKAHLVDRFSDDTDVKVSKNKIRYRSRALGCEGSILFTYISSANGYVLDMFANCLEFNQWVKSLNPPYRSNLLTDATLSMTSSSEKTKTFSNEIGGAVRLPIDDNRIKAQCTFIGNKVAEIFLPRLKNIVDFNPEVVDDVCKNPDDYSYPFLVIVYAINKHKLDISKLNEDIIFSRKMRKGGAFDKELLHGF